MVLNGKIMVKDRKGNIKTMKISDAVDKMKTYQILSMNHHGHENYSFSLIDEIKLTANSDESFYEVVVRNHLEQERKIICSTSTQIFATTTNWSGFVSPNKLKKNHLLIDEDDRLNKLVSVTPVTIADDDIVHKVFPVYNNNYFCNGILIR